jgi:hypothetical protein
MEDSSANVLDPSRSITRVVFTPNIVLSSDTSAQLSKQQDHLSQGEST